MIWDIEICDLGHRRMFVKKLELDSSREGAWRSQEL